MLDTRHNSIGNIWKTINTICSYKSQNSHTSIDHLTTDQGIITVDRDIASAFNDYFASVGANLASKIDRTSNCFQDYLPHPTLNSFFVEPTTENEIFNTIMSLNKSSSTGSDGVISRVLVLAINFSIIARPICK